MHQTWYTNIIISVKYSDQNSYAQTRMPAFLEKQIIHRLSHAQMFSLLV